jgi:hypothetical protein
LLQQPSNNPSTTPFASQSKQETRYIPPPSHPHSQEKNHMHDNLFDDDTLRDAYLMGIDPHLPFYDLNLAGAQGIPDVRTIASAVQPATANAPTFTAPDSSVPALAPMT